MGLHIQMDQPNQLADPAYQHRRQQHQYQKSFFLSASKPWHLRTLFYDKCGTGYGIHQTTACHTGFLAPTSGLHPVCTSGWWCKLQPNPWIFGHFGDHHQPPTKASHGPLAMWDYHWLVVDLPLWIIWLRQLGWWHSQLNGKTKHVWNHQPDHFWADSNSNTLEHRQNLLGQIVACSNLMVTKSGQGKCCPTEHPVVSTNATLLPHIPKWYFMR